MVPTEITEYLEHANGNYQLIETWKGKGIYALLGKAKRTSAGTLGGRSTNSRSQLRETFMGKSGSLLKDATALWSKP